MAVSPTGRESCDLLGQAADRSVQHVPPTADIVNSLTPPLHPY